MLFTSTSTFITFNTTVLSIVNLSQSVAALLGNLAAFTNAYATTLINTIQLIKNDVFNLPLSVTQRNEIINVLNLAETILTQARAAGFITIEQVNAVLNLLDLAINKINVFSFPLFFGPLQTGSFSRKCCC